MTRRLAREEALLVGGSCGLAVVAALRVAATAGPDDVIVVLLPDGGRGYLSKIFNDDWMADYGFLSAADRRAARSPTCWSSKQGGLPPFVHAHPDERSWPRIESLREYDVSQLPVLKRGAAGDGGRGDRLDRGARPARRAGLRPGQAAGPGRRAHVRRRCRWSARASRSAGRCDALEKAGAAVVLVEGKPGGMITRQDVLTFLAGSQTGAELDRGRRIRDAGDPRRPGAGPAHRRRGAADLPGLHLQAGQDGGAAGCGRGGALDRGLRYSRTANPTRAALEECLAALEGGARALAFASGMAAEDCLLRTVCAPGDHVLIPHDAYGGTYRLFDKVLSRWQRELPPGAAGGPRRRPAARSPDRPGAGGLGGDADQPAAVGRGHHRARAGVPGGGRAAGGGQHVRLPVPAEPARARRRRGGPFHHEVPGRAFRRGRRRGGGGRPRSRRAPRFYRRTRRARWPARSTRG